MEENNDREVVVIRQNATCVQHVLVDPIMKISRKYRHIISRKKVEDILFLLMDPTSIQELPMGLTSSQELMMGLTSSQELMICSSACQRGRINLVVRSARLQLLSLLVYTLFPC